MSFSRRTFLLGAGSGLSLLVLAACTDPSVKPTPTPSPTRPGTVPAPSSFHRSNWASDPFSRGATSYLEVGASPQARETLRQPLIDRVFFAGEAVSDEPGTIRGAIDSGAAAARALIAVAGDGERIAVIGAGASGIEAARQLAMRGVDVVLIEARDRTGGRIDSRTTEADVPVELGAWRLADGSDDELISRLERAGAAVLPLAGASAFAEGSTVSEVESGTEQLATSVAGAIEAARQQAADVSVAEAIEQFGLAGDLDADGALLLNQLLAQLAAASGADAADQTSWFLTRMIGEPTSVPDGPMSALFENALDGIDPALSTVVVAVFYDDDGVSLRLGTGESLAVDRVILTVPLGVLKEQAIEFDPVLPLLHRSAIDELSVGHVEVVVLEFEQPFWQTEAVVWLNDDEDAAVRLWVNLLPVTGERILLGVVGGEAALELSDLDDDAVLEAAQRSLAVFA